MELSTIKSLLELAGGPAFALEQGVIRFADPKAADLGLNPGTPLSAVLPDAVLPEPGEEPAETSVSLTGRDWSLRTVTAPGVSLCFLRPLPGRIPAPNERTLIRTAGSIRLALQDLMIALDGLADTVCEDPAAAEQASLALRSVYRLRRTAGDLELLAALCAGTYRLCRQDCQPVAATAELCAEMGELLRPVGRRLTWKLPQGEMSCCLDWPLTAALLRELIANAAADTADGEIHLTLTRTGKNRLCFTLRSMPTEARAVGPFPRRETEASELWGGDELALSLVSAGAECHGGGLLLSTEPSGACIALLTLAAGDRADEAVRSLVQLPQDQDASLVALSPILPKEFYRLEDLL